MEKFKDYFYNKNDIVVAILILLIAAIIIFLCFRSIIHYPDHLGETGSLVQTVANTISPGLLG